LNHCEAQYAHVAVVASIRTTTAEPAPWIDDDDRLQRAVSQRLGSVKYSRVRPAKVHDFSVVLAR